MKIIFFKYIQIYLLILTLSHAQEVDTNSRIGIKFHSRQLPLIEVKAEEIDKYLETEKDSAPNLTRDDAESRIFIQKAQESQLTILNDSATEDISQKECAQNVIKKISSYLKNDAFREKVEGLKNSIKLGVRFDIELVTSYSDSGPGNKILGLKINLNSYDLKDKEALTRSYSDTVLNSVDRTLQIAESGDSMPAHKMIPNISKMIMSNTCLDKSLNDDVFDSLFSGSLDKLQSHLSDIANRRELIAQENKTITEDKLKEVPKVQPKLPNRTDLPEDILIVEGRALGKKIQSAIKKGQSVKDTNASRPWIDEYNNLISKNACIAKTTQLFKKEYFFNIEKIKTDFKKYCNKDLLLSANPYIEFIEVGPVLNDRINKDERIKKLKASKGGATFNLDKKPLIVGFLIKDSDISILEGVSDGKDIPEDFPLDVCLADSADYVHDLIDYQFKKLKDKILIELNLSQICNFPVLIDTNDSNTTRTL